MTDLYLGTYILQILTVHLACEINNAAMFAKKLPWKHLLCQQVPVLNSDMCLIKKRRLDFYY